MKFENWRSYLLILTGTLGIFLGCGFTALYIWEAIIVRIGEPDQSLLFWYLPLLFLGLLIGGGGLALFSWGISRFRNGP